MKVNSTSFRQPADRADNNARRSTGRRCACCTHKKADDINKHIAGRASFRDISRQYGVNHASVARHVEICLKLEIQALVKQNAIEHSINHSDVIMEQPDHAKQLFTASYRCLCNPAENAREWLRPHPIYDEDINDGADNTANQREGRHELELLSTLPERTEPNPDTIEKEWIIDLLDSTVNMIGCEVADKLRDLIETVQASERIAGVPPNETVIRSTDIWEFAVDCMHAIELVLDNIAKVEDLYHQNREKRERVGRFLRSVDDYLDLHPKADWVKVVKAFSLGGVSPEDTIGEELGNIG